ncbi:MAG: late competence development ComFB family protein [Oscillospiraceae bacterium]|nr:late competence development ComFB family protein [Oscillospiraceae bacterium]
MATKKADKNSKTVKSNKTAHVLNLIAAPARAEQEVGKKDAPLVEEAPKKAVAEERIVPAAPAMSPEPAVSPTPAAPPEPAAAPLGTAASPILEVARANDDLLSEQIREALVKAFEEEYGADALTAPMPSEKGRASGPKPAAVFALEPEPSPAPEPKPEPVPSPAPERETPPGSDIIVLNVMEKLVDMKAPYYIKLFGLCTCERCAADVRALTLTRLQPHYVAIPAKDEGMVVTLYDNKLNSEIVSQLTKSCQTVLSKPRH